MRYNLFNISTEEADQVLNNVPEEENDEVLTSEDPIEKLESSFNKTADDTAKEIENYENCSNCEEELQEQVEVIDEQITDKPEEVTEDIVVVAQEAFYNSLNKVLSLEELNDVKKQVSSESVNLPVEKLILTREGIMDVIKKIVEKIKQAFQQVGLFFKKLWVKFVIFMDGTAKRANEVYKKYKTKTTSEITLSKDQEDFIKEKIGLLVYAKDSLYASMLLPFIKYRVTAIDKVNDSSLDNLFKVNSALSKTIRLFQNGDVNMFDKLKYLINEETNITKNNVSGVNQIISVIGSEVKYIYFKMNEDKQTYGECLYETIQINKDIKIPNKLDPKRLVDDLKVIELYAKGASSYKDRLLEVQASARKALDQIAKDNEDEVYTKTQLKFIQLLGTKMILDNIMQYVKNCKNMLQVTEFILSTIDYPSSEEIHNYLFSNEGIFDFMNKKNTTYR